MEYGYAGVSTADQNADMQHAALKKARCKKLFTDDGISGATTKRPALLRCLKTLQSGDTLMVWKLDRLGRSLRDLITMLDDLKRRHVKFRSLTEAIDSETAVGRAMWQMIGVLAGARAQPDRRTHPRRSASSTGAGHEIRVASLDSPGSSSNTPASC